MRTRRQVLIALMKQANTMLNDCIILEDDLDPATSLKGFVTHTFILADDELNRMNKKNAQAKARRLRNKTV